MRAILTYHSIDDSRSAISLEAAVFERHLRYLGQRGVALVPLSEIVSLPADRNAAAITFDDGFRNFADAAWPLLREAGAPVTLFIATDYVGRRNDWSGGGVRVPALPLLDWDELGRLAAEGVTIGAHSRSHADLRRVEPTRLREELEGSAAQIERHTGARPSEFAYPYGRHDARVVAAARASFARACTTELRALGAGEDPHRLPRLDSHYLRDAEWLRRWGTGSLARYLGVRARVRRVRGLVMEGVLRR